MKYKNIEKQLADKLGNQSIEPSAQAWNRIVHSRQQGKDKKLHKRTVIYYAASVVLLMLSAGYFFLSSNDDAITEPKVVSSDKPKKTIIKKEPFLIPENVNLEQSEAIVYKKAVAEENFKGDENKQQHAIVLPYEKPEIDIKLPEINVATPAVVKVKTFNRDEYYEQQAETLLNNAVKDVAVNRQLSKPVNDTALLREVEAEMDEYYREKAMSIFSLKHKTIRIAVKDKQ